MRAHFVPGESAASRSAVECGVGDAAAQETFLNTRASECSAASDTRSCLIPAANDGSGRYAKNWLAVARLLSLREVTPLVS